MPPFDKHETGRITFENLKHVAKELGERMIDEELQEIIDMMEWASSICTSWACCCSV